MLNGDWTRRKWRLEGKGENLPKCQSNEVRSNVKMVTDEVRDSLNVLTFPLFQSHPVPIYLTLSIYLSFELSLNPSLCLLETSSLSDK